MPATPYVVTGRALLGEDLTEECVRITVEDGIIASIEPYTGKADRWISPAFFNAHTHLGDTVAMDLPAEGRSLADLVKPPDGLKHRILVATPRDRLIAGMRASIRTMVSTGTAGFVDFREGGVAGVEALRKAAAGLPCRPVIFGREGGERVSDGIGISSVHDVPDAEEQVRNARIMGRLVAFHAGEKNANDVDEALGFEPDMLVHCTHATDAQLRRAADMDIPIVVCTRSNWVLGVAASPAHPPIRRIRESGGRFFLGTDNVMFVQPDMLAEMAFVANIYREPPEEILRAAIAGPFRDGVGHFIEEGHIARFIVINPTKSNLSFSRDLRTTIVRRLDASAIEQNVLTLQ